MFSTYGGNGARPAACPSISLGACEDGDYDDRHTSARGSAATPGGANSDDFFPNVPTLAEDTDRGKGANSMKSPKLDRRGTQIRTGDLLVPSQTVICDPMAEWRSRGMTHGELYKLEIEVTMDEVDEQKAIQVARERYRATDRAQILVDENCTSWEENSRRRVCGRRD